MTHFEMEREIAEGVFSSVKVINISAASIKRNMFAIHFSDIYVDMIWIHQNYIALNLHINANDNVLEA